jgi:hypothetical protein
LAWPKPGARRNPYKGCLLLVNPTPVDLIENFKKQLEA